MIQTVNHFGWEQKILGHWKKDHIFTKDPMRILELLSKVLTIERNVRKFNCLLVSDTFIKVNGFSYT